MCTTAPGLSFALGWLRGELKVEFNGLLIVSLNRSRSVAAATEGAAGTTVLRTVLQWNDVAQP
jgi:hypothetical protein